MTRDIQVVKKILILIYSTQTQVWGEICMIERYRNEIN